MDINLPRQECVDKSKCVFVDGCASLGCSLLNRPFRNLLSMLFSWALPGVVKKAEGKPLSEAKNVFSEEAKRTGKWKPEWVGGGGVLWAKRLMGLNNPPRYWLLLRESHCIAILSLVLFSQSWLFVVACRP